MRVKTSECVRLEFSGSWGFQFDGYEHAHFGVVAHGSCWLALPQGSEATPLSPGDCWLLPSGRTHILRSHPRAQVRAYDEIRFKKARGLLRHSGGKGGPTTIIVGNFTFDGQSGKWLTDALPELITFRMDQGNSSAMQTVLQILAQESQTDNMGSTVVVSRLADILFVQAIRAYVGQAGPPGAGWLRAMADGQLRLALGVMHEALEKRWTVASLASTAGMSRSSFAARFKELMGECPLEYLTRWRMHKAAQLLRESDLKLAKVASLVGYDSDGAFNKTFKRTMSTAPGAYRASFRHQFISQD